MRAFTENWHQQPIWRRIALPMSLVLNIFLIAVIGGHMLHRHAHDAALDGSFLKRALADAEASLSKPDAEAFGAVLRRDAPRYRPAAADFAQAREALAKQIETEPFDKEAVRRAFAASRESWDRLTGEFGNTLVDALADVSPEGRRKLVAERRRSMGGAPVAE
ncbi:periplasmic heavy metal sensor [Methyloferula stellata]|uniref:periplasmic heavy metal sensor n=1 Tax=Methyloferula stellata TaxID=876270 RepID=UPI0006865E86|nr:periplasmic heavy metal sensor [Methyloferula stellata]